MTYIIGLVLATIALFVTYASVVGVGSMFASTAVPVMVAWTGVELGKYAAMSYAYANWKTLKAEIRVVLTAFIVFIMLLTSIGVYAYLGQSYAHVTTEVSKNDVDIEAKQKQLDAQRARLSQIDKQIAEVPNTNTAQRIRLMNRFDEERKPVVTDIASLERDLAQLKSQNIDTSSHVGIIKFLADSFGVPVERATMFAILAVTLCLDPFAMLLNVLLQRIRLTRAPEEEKPVNPERSRDQRLYEDWMVKHKPNSWEAKDIMRRRGLLSDEQIRDRKIELGVVDNSDLRTTLVQATAAAQGEDANIRQLYEDFGFGYNAFTNMIGDLLTYGYKRVPEPTVEPVSDKVYEYELVPMDKSEPEAEPEPFNAETQAQIAAVIASNPDATPEQQRQVEQYLGLKPERPEINEK